MKSVKLGVIGTGWGEMHIDAFKRVKNAEVIAVCDSNVSRARDVARNAKVPHVYEDYRELLSNDNIDLVSIASPPFTHEEIAQRALAARKNILCELPLGLNRKQAQGLVDEAAKSGVVTAVANQTRFLPSYAYAKELIDEDYLGLLLRANVTMTLARPWGTNGSWAADDALGGGVLNDVAIHFIDALQWWFGPVEAVMGDRATLFPEIRVALKVGKESQIGKWRATADDAFTALLRFERSGTAVLNFVTGARQDWGWMITLYGTQGTLQITSGSLAGMREGEREWGLIEIPRRLELPDRPREPLMWALVRLCEGMVAQVRGEKLDKSIPSFMDGLENLKVVDAIKRSSDDMLWVSV